VIWEDEACGKSLDAIMQMQAGQGHQAIICHSLSALLQAAERAGERGVVCLKIGWPPACRRRLPSIPLDTVSLHSSLLQETPLCPSFALGLCKHLLIT
jgi:hypothetical protein